MLRLRIHYWSLAAAAMGSGLVACGPWQRVGTAPVADPNVLVPRLFDAPSIYEGMGLFAARDPLPFVAGMRFLAGADPDSTLAVFGLSLANRSLSFRRAGSIFEARYRVELSFRREGRVIRQVSADETVRVASFMETQRSDESVIFQQLVALPPGPVLTVISLRDRFSTGFNRADGTVVVPRFGLGPALSGLVPVYHGRARVARAELPDIVVNPRATAAYGSDTLTFYLEGYGIPDGQPVTLRALAREEADQEVWRDTVTLAATATLGAAVVRVEPEQVPVGELRFEAFLPGGADTARTAALVSFSDQWVVANFDETLFLLRYFGQEAALQRMQDAPAEQRPELWKAFWQATDPNPHTPEHEALDEYFRRLQEANERFREGSEAGWLTDRGEVFITLGEPDEIFDSSSDLQGRGVRFIRWTYIGERLTLDFVDETGFGRFRLTAASRSDYLQALNRIRRSS